MKKMKHFSELTEIELSELKNQAQEAMINVSKKIGMSGLSEIGSHNLYVAVQDAIQSEHDNAKKARKRRFKKRCPDAEIRPQMNWKNRNKKKKS